MTYASLLHVGTMPDDSDRLNNETIYGASRSIQVLSNHVGNVSGNWHKSRLPVGRRNVSEHRRWQCTISRRSDIRYLSVEIVGKSLSGKPRISERCTISTSAQSIVNGTPQRRLVTTSVPP